CHAANSDWGHAELTQQRLDKMCEQVLRRKYGSSEDELVDDLIDCKDDGSRLPGKQRTQLSTPTVVDKDCSPESICKRHKLNQRQAMAFFMVADVIMKEIAA